MGTFTETKKNYEALLEKLSEMRLRELRVDRLESTGTTASGTYVLMSAANDFNTDRPVRLRFDGVGYINLPTRCGFDVIKLAHGTDARPIETDLSYTLIPPIWVVCIQQNRDGAHEPTKYFIAAEKLDIQFE